jgi:hypothetical protein
MPYFINIIEHNTNEIKQESGNELSIRQIKTSHKDSASGPQNKLMINQKDSAYDQQKKLSIKQIRTSHKDSASGPHNKLSINQIETSHKDIASGPKSVSPSPSPSPSPSVSTSVLIDRVSTNLLNLLDNTPSPTKILDTLSTVTTGYTASVIVPAPPSIAAVFISNQTTYPNLVGSTLPVAIATTTTNPTTGNEVLDVSQVTSTTIVVVPSLIEGSTIEISGVKLTRGTGSQSNKLFLNTVEFELGSPITIGNKIFQLSGIGSPVVFTVKSNDQPVTILDYIFKYSYFFAFIGAIFYSISTVINIEPMSVFLNKNVLLIFNIYITICAIISLHVWYNIKVPFNIFNQNVVATYN